MSPECQTEDVGRERPGRRGGIKGHMAELFTTVGSWSSAPPVRNSRTHLRSTTVACVPDAPHFPIVGSLPLRSCPCAPAQVRRHLSAQEVPPWQLLKSEVGRGESTGDPGHGPCHGGARKVSIGADPRVSSVLTVYSQQGVFIHILLIFKNYPPRDVLLSFYK